MADRHTASHRGRSSSQPLLAAACEFCHNQDLICRACLGRAATSVSSISGGQPPTPYSVPHGHASILDTTTDPQLAALQFPQPIPGEPQFEEPRDYENPADRGLDGIVEDLKGASDPRWEGPYNPSYNLRPMPAGTMALGSAAPPSGISHTNLANPAQHEYGYLGPAPFQSSPSVNSESSCPECLRDFEKRGDMLRHVDQTHTKIKRNFICTECEEAFYYQKDLDRHMKTHNRQDLYFCDHGGCKNPNFNRKDNFKRHMAKQHYAEVIFCEAKSCLTWVVDGRTNDDLKREHAAGDHSC